MLDAGLPRRSQQSRAEGQNPFPRPAAHAALDPILHLSFPTPVCVLPQYTTVVAIPFLQLEMLSINLHGQWDNYHVRLGAA